MFDIKAHILYWVCLTKAVFLLCAWQLQELSQLFINLRLNIASKYLFCDRRDPEVCELFDKLGTAISSDHYNRE